MLAQLLWKAAAHESDRKSFRINLIYFVRIGMIQTCIGVYFVEVIDTQIINRRFVFNDIVLPEYPTDGFLNRNLFCFF